MFDDNVTVFRGEFVVRTLYSGLSAVTAFGLLLLCSGGLSGCDSKPSDGAQVTDSGPIEPEQKAKVKAFYADRHKAATKPTAHKK
jgi:hypothetical protein